MYLKLLPIHIEGSGKNGSLIIEVRKEDVQQKLVERGLPPMVFGADVPSLELKSVNNK